ncbi:C4-dicarboxylate ABC transporter [Virgibacillus phasianinus]|uniref:C4-dicarboxylate ABC transporter n=1 Tax=Virgibacillus phasianinus TaxID=2017483 RepID=A0A220TZL0_9BACI|nr:C4-dicarboxylate ABC transporter [Virgibacillus phasianinus]ASK61212.1 C4-dicarboxylate ABC transporter [Virgibacillus phasianinus]
MAEAIDREESQGWSLWVGWIGIIVGIAAFFMTSFWVGIAAIILGIIALCGKSTALGWWGIGIGVVAIIFQTIF